MAQIVLERMAAQFPGGEIIAAGSQHGDEWARVSREAWLAVATFLRRWRSYEPKVVHVRGRGGTVEYNVVLGAVVFGFDAAKTLQAVGFAAGTAAPALCVIPAACVVPRVA